MNCETCGNPVDAKDAERGSCLHCGAVLPHVLRAAEKAEIVRRVVAQGNSVRIEGDRIEAGAPPGPPREGPDGAIIETRTAPIVISVAVAMIMVSIGFVSFLLLRSRTEPPLPVGTAVPERRPLVRPSEPKFEPPAPISDKPSREPAPKDNADPAVKPPPAGPRAPAAPRTVEAVVAANKAQYDRCQRAELGRNPSAARRYSVAVTVDGQGRAEWVELLSEASAEMKSCVQAVTRGLEFPKPAAGSSRSIVTLSFSGSP